MGIEIDKYGNILYRDMGKQGERSERSFDKLSKTPFGLRAFGSSRGGPLRTGPLLVDLALPS